ncbi:hypothetical protein FRC08_018658 [Ceratobasidium sp. 394]|nr:hypothetical protein FRC08_018658 [Ceratobasidium sp. 394]
MVGKKLNFYSYGLEGAATLILTFKPPDSPEPEPNRIPIAWKIIKLAPHAGVYSKATVHYIPRLAFGHAQSEDDSLVAPSIWIEVKNGDHTSITGEDGERHFTHVSHRDSSKTVTCANSSDSPTDLTLGLVKNSGINTRFEPIFLWKSVGRGINIGAQFAPILMAYATREQDANEFLRIAGAVNAEPIWSQNLDELDRVTGWNFMEDEGCGQFIIEPAEST